MLHNQAESAGPTVGSSVYLNAHLWDNIVFHRCAFYQLNISTYYIKSNPRRDFLC